MRLRLALTAALVVTSSLSAAVVESQDTTAATPTPTPWSDAWLLAHTDTFLADDDARRTALVRSLTNPDNLYARMRIAAYGRASTGWDVLPTWNPRAVPLDDGHVAALRAGEVPRLPAKQARLWDGERPQTMAGWVALGRRVFFEYPLRPEPAAEHAVVDDARAATLGLQREGGTYPGLVVFADIDGTDKVGITCALCHANVEDGELVVGRARRDLDYGAMLLTWHGATGEPIAPELAARMTSWGPGRADITEDDDQDPVAIPDLWRLRDLRYLTQAATIVHDRKDGNATPLALAIRQETQYIHANGERTRPPRELAWALAMYLYSLETPAAPDDGAPVEQRARGRALFDRHCDDCHGDASHSGDVVAARRVGTDAALADGTSRGTGFYRPAPLVAVAMAGPYLHDGTVATLDDLFDPARLRPHSGPEGREDKFDRRVTGNGPVLGHAYGTSLPEADRDALIAFLRTL